MPKPYNLLVGSFYNLQNLWALLCLIGFQVTSLAADPKSIIEMDKTFELHLALKDDLVLSVDNNGYCSWKPIKEAKPVRLRFVEGLADPTLVSLESADLTGQFLRHSLLRLRIMPEPVRIDRMFESDATFEIRPGPDGQGICLRSFNLKDAFIGSTYRKKAYVVPDPIPEDYTLTIIYRDGNGK